MKRRYGEPTRNRYDSGAQFSRRERCRRTLWLIQSKIAVAGEWQVLAPSGIPCCRSGFLEAASRNAQHATRCRCLALQKTDSQRKNSDAAKSRVNAKFR